MSELGWGWGWSTGPKRCPICGQVEGEVKRLRGLLRWGLDIVGMVPDGIGGVVYGTKTDIQAVELWAEKVRAALKGKPDG